MGRTNRAMGREWGGSGLYEPRGNVWPLGPGAREEQLLPVSWAFGTCWGRDKVWTD